MEIYDWNIFWRKRWSISYLINLAKKYENCQFYAIPIKLRINYLMVQLCCRRDNLTLPIEMWNIICEYIRKDIKYFCPKECIMPDDLVIRIDHNIDTGFNLTKYFINKYDVVPRDINEIEKYIKIGLVYCQGCRGFGYLFYIIVDINFEYKVISFIEEYDDNGHNFLSNDIITVIDFQKRNYIRMITYNNFISNGRYGDEDTFIFLDDPVNYVFPPTKIQIVNNM